MWHPVPLQKPLFAGKSCLLAESKVHEYRQTLTLARGSKELAFQEDTMMAQQKTSRRIRSISGAGVLAIGLFLLFVNLDGVTAQISYASGAPSETLGILPALGLAGVRALHTYAFDPSLFLSSLLQILVSFWPLLLIVTAAMLLRPLARGEAGPQGLSAESSATSARGDR